MLLLKSTSALPFFNNIWLVPWPCFHFIPSCNHLLTNLWLVPLLHFHLISACNHLLPTFDLFTNYAFALVGQSWGAWPGTSMQRTHIHHQELWPSLVSAWTLHLLINLCHPPGKSACVYFLLVCSWAWPLTMTDNLGCMSSSLKQSLVCNDLINTNPIFSVFKKHIWWALNSSFYK